MFRFASWRIGWRALTRTHTVGLRRSISKATTTTETATPLLLRDYQEECINTVLAALDSGKKRLGVSLATGSGKTVIFTQLLDRVKPTASGAEQTLILAHRRELVEQAARHCTRAYPDKTVEVEMGNLHASGAADITIASVQSITSGARLGKFSPKRFKLVLVDEAHHIVSASYMRVLAHFGLAEKETKKEKTKETKNKRDGPALVGVSATMARFDGLALGAAIDEIVYHKDYVDMIGDGWLSDVVFTTVESTADLSRVRSGGVGKDFQASDLSLAVNTDAVNRVTVQTWLAKAHEAGRKSTLVFCVDISHVQDLTSMFRAFGVDAQYVTGNTNKVERSQRLDAFKRGEFPVLVNCGVFTEGTDMPNVDCIVLARPTKSRNLLVQMIGRGMRLHSGKTNCHIIDLVSSLSTGVVTTPTLFGLDPAEIVSEASADDLNKLREDRENNNMALLRNPSVEPQIKSVSITDYSSVYDLIADTTGEKHIRATSKNAWVQVGDDRYILGAPSGSFLRIERADPNNEGYQFQLVFLQVLPDGIASSPYARPRVLSRNETLTDVVHSGDTYATKHFPFAFINRYQRWRKNPPTKGQLDFVNKIRGKHQKPLTADDITSGTASDMITKIKHGARGRFADLESRRRRLDKEATILDLTRKREQVTVGPLPA